MELVHYTRTTKLTNYFPIPRSILEQNLPPTAVLIYGLLLDRATLSQKHDYADALGWIYVLYTQEELAKTLSVSARIVRKYISLLKKAGLIRVIRKSRQYANQYFLLIPSDAAGTSTGSYVPLHRNDPEKDTGTKVPPINRKNQQDSIHHYQHSEEESL